MLTTPLFFVDGDEVHSHFSIDVYSCISLTSVLHCKMIVYESGKKFSRVPRFVKVFAV